MRPDEIRKCAVPDDTLDRPCDTTQASALLEVQQPPQHTAFFTSATMLTSSVAVSSHDSFVKVRLVAEAERPPVSP